MSGPFWTSDTHYNHANIIAYSHRPYGGLAEMTEALIKNWNDVVGPEDVIYHLGDFAMGDKGLIPGIFARLNGIKHLVLGNHDMKHNGVTMLKQIEEAPWASINKELTVTVDGYKLYMRHEPNMAFLPNADADFHLCGHVHNSWNRVGPIINVGVDVNDFRPKNIHALVAMEEVKGQSHRGY